MVVRYLLLKASLDIYAPHILLAPTNALRPCNTRQLSKTAINIVKTGPNLEDDQEEVGTSTHCPFGEGPHPIDGWLHKSRPRHLRSGTRSWSFCRRYSSVFGPILRSPRDRDIVLACSGLGRSKLDHRHCGTELGSEKGYGISRDVRYGGFGLLCIRRQGANRRLSRQVSSNAKISKVERRHTKICRPALWP